MLSELPNQIAAHATEWILLILLVPALWGIRWVLARRFGDTPGRRARNQALLLALGLLAIVVVILVVPGLDPSTRGNLLGLFGIIASGAIALSSTTFLGNAMAGLMLRSMQHYRPGDYLRCGEHFGRVSEQGLFHTEIQTQERDLTTLPNLFLVTNPVTVVSTGGTIVSAQVGLGYDVPRRRVEELLLEAASQTGLEDAFVSVLELQDHAVVYRVAGLLGEVRELISTRSRLHKRVLDVLHGEGIEIVSPGFVVVRGAGDGPVIPEAEPEAAEEPAAPEAILFDKADLAASIESLRDLLEAIDHEVESLAEESRNGEGDGEENYRLARRGRLEAQRDRLRERLEAAQKELEEKR